MSEKVKLTQEQADEIEKIKRVGLPCRWKKDGWEIDRSKVLNNLNLNNFLEAIYGDYEIYQEFKDGEYIVYENDIVKNTMKIIELIGEYIKVEPIYKGFTRYNLVNVNSPLIRHATPEEITEEKERRWWANHNRDVWDLKQEDVVIDRFNRIREVDEDDGDTVSFFGGFTSSKEYVKETCKVVCFADDRKDV